MGNDIPHNQIVPNEKNDVSHGCILVVDDNAVIRKITTVILAELGYEALIAPDGQTAVEVFLEHKSKIDLILLDMRMPGMTGAECFYRLRKIAPDVKIVMVAAQPEDAELERLEHDGMAGHLNKPYRFEALKDLFRRLIPR